MNQLPTKTAADRYIAGVETDIGRGTWFDPRAGQQTLRCFADQWLPARRVGKDPFRMLVRDYVRMEEDQCSPRLGLLVTPRARIEGQDADPNR